MVLEDEVLASNLSNDEKKIILYTTSIARYSGSFWSNHGRKKFFGWVVAADVVGGILGGITAGVVGALGGASGASGIAHNINESK